MFGISANRFQVKTANEQAEAITNNETNTATGLMKFFSRNGATTRREVDACAQSRPN
jgi:hypothetical protein